MKEWNCCFPFDFLDRSEFLGQDDGCGVGAVELDVVDRVRPGVAQRRCRVVRRRDGLRSSVAVAVVAARRRRHRGGGGDVVVVVVVARGELVAQRYLVGHLEGLAQSQDHLGRLILDKRNDIRRWTFSGSAIVLWPFTVKLC